MCRLKIGDKINFTDDGGSSVTRIVQNIESDTRLQTFVGLGTALATSKELVRQRSKLQIAENSINSVTEFSSKTWFILDSKNLF